MSESLMSLQEVAEFLKVPQQTVYAWRAKGLGPRGYRVGKFVRFRESEVRNWLEKHADPDRERVAR